jgi:DNA-binding transcriptional LysR family regulator
MDRLETRELEYFLAVAGELHFGRAAARLMIAQPALSKAIRKLEQRLGVRLLERSSRHVRLTAAGEVLLDEGRRALDAVLAAARHAQQAGSPGARLRLVVKPGGDGGLLPGILAVYEQEPDVRPWRSPSAMPTAGRPCCVTDARTWHSCTPRTRISEVSMPKP